MLRYLIFFSFLLLPSFSFAMEYQQTDGSIPVGLVSPVSSRGMFTAFSNVQGLFRSFSFQIKSQGSSQTTYQWDLWQCPLGSGDPTATSSPTYSKVFSGCPQVGGLSATGTIPAGGSVLTVDITSTSSTYSFDADYYYLLWVKTISVGDQGTNLMGQAISSPYASQVLSCNGVGACSSPQLGTMYYVLETEFSESFVLTPTSEPWVSIESPVGSYSTNNNIPFKVYVNTGTTSVDNLVLQFSSSYQTFAPIQFPVVTTGISVFDGFIDFPALNDIPTLTATAWMGTTTAYASSSRQFNIVVIGDDPLSYDPNQYLVQLDSECGGDDSGAIVNFLCWVFIPASVDQVTAVLNNASSSIPFVEDALSGITLFQSYVVGASGSSTVGTLSISLDFPIGLNGATTTIEMFSVERMTYLMGDSGPIFRTIAQIGLWIAFITMIISSVSSMIGAEYGGGRLTRL